MIDVEKMGFRGQFDPSSVPDPMPVGIYHVYPDLTGKRIAEGGRRLSGFSSTQDAALPLVSVIIVCLNSANTIENTLASLHIQDYPNVEVIVIDGLSSDGTVDILCKYNHKIDYFVSEPDDGLYYAMNKGISLASGDFILILNSDDWYEADAISSLVKAADYSGCDFVSALAKYVRPDGSTYTLRSMPFNMSQLLRMSIRHETMLIASDIYKQIGVYDTRYKILADREFASRLLLSGKTHYEIPRPILNFRTTGTSNTNLKQLQVEQDQILLQHFPFLSKIDARRLNEHTTATPQTFHEVIGKHSDKSEFIIACVDFIRDYAMHHGKKWQDHQIDSLPDLYPDTVPIVSVILPFYNAEDSIERTINSVLNQTIRHLEIICVDDRAIDGSQSVVRKKMVEDPRVRLIENAENIGLGASRNAGVRSARGMYVFHVDPDDTLPRDALERLVDIARTHGSQIVRGAFKMEQYILGIKSERQVKLPLGEKEIVINTCLKERKELLHSTEGHWSHLYDSSFARQVYYPTDLKMGQDSAFFIHLYLRAVSISLVPYIVYEYLSNPKSAMNSMGPRKCFDEIVWRLRSSILLKEWNYNELSRFILYDYWNKNLFQHIEENLSEQDQELFWDKLALAFIRYGSASLDSVNNDKIKPIFKNNLSKRLVCKPGIVNSEKNAHAHLNIGMFNTRDHGGAGIATLRCAKSIRKLGYNVELYSVFKNLHSPHIHLLPLSSDVPERDQPKKMFEVYQNKAVVSRAKYPALKSGELFSKTGSVVDWTKFTPTLDELDIVHLHWVNGLLDIGASTNVLADIPIVWTLHDMNPFTGGCHYSEGCENFQRGCKSCPLLGGGQLSDLYHKEKLKAYSSLRNMHIVTPSKWLADLASKSILFKDRPIHVIYNPLPTDVFKPINKLAARKELGLPVERKYILFGADSLTNHRKGGDILKRAIGAMNKHGSLTNVECLLFGDSQIDFGVPTRNLGRVSDEKRSALIYSAADVFAFPSREDNGPLTVSESLSSGTPVVSFPVGYVTEIVKHMETGYIARYADHEDFAEGLAWALAAPRSSSALQRSMLCHESILDFFDPYNVASQYVDLYHSILD